MAGQNEKKINWREEQLKSKDIIFILVLITSILYKQNILKYIFANSNSPNDIQKPFLSNARQQYMESSFKCSSFIWGAADGAEGSGAEQCMWKGKMYCAIRVQ